MRKLIVSFQYSKEDIEKVGTLIENNKKFYFEYDSSFLEKQINISPFKLKLDKGLQENTEDYPNEIFGVFNDSLPDGWGMLLMDRFFRKQGKDINRINSLDRLSYISNNAMGALTYYPSIENNIDTKKNEINLNNLAKNSLSFLQGKTENILPTMAKAGDSPGGARPKILVGYNQTTDNLISGESEIPTEFQHWLIKFNSKQDNKDSAKIEYIYYEMAKEAKIKISESKLFSDKNPDNDESYYFGTKRFDRSVSNSRIHIHSLSNLIHANFRIPALDYETFIKVNSILTKNDADIIMGFRIMIFNIFSCNRDDHSKNFSYIMDRKGNWSLAPAYDLTFSTGINGEHSTSVAGEGKSPSLSDIKKIGTIAGISERIQTNIIEEVRTAVSTWKSKAIALSISSKEIKIIESWHNKIGRY